jgi:hypothetical protein
VAAGSHFPAEWEWSVVVRPISKQVWIEQKYDHSSRNQKRLSRRGTEAIYRTGLDSILSYRAMEQERNHTTAAQAEVRNKIN